jgi:hypothetical protein
VDVPHGLRGVGLNVRLHSGPICFSVKYRDLALMVNLRTVLMLKAISVRSDLSLLLHILRFPLILL